MSNFVDSPAYKQFAMWAGIAVAVWFTATFYRFVQLKEKELDNSLNAGNSTK